MQQGCVKVNAGLGEWSPYKIVNVKFLALGVVALVASTAFAQIKPEEQSIEQAFEGLRAHPGLQITHKGTTQVGPSESTFESISTLFQDIEDGRPMVKLEMVI